ncbi:hypothetical protein SAMN05216262_10263 [Colwellia chukchiensis]|uniref:Uncharacterized protein n=1 Tax=Colwellia chukchiensis TaxID=641665 RepID=A0A1H7IV87_9GAMM|nr:hypothetical protein SAMN05216262_10263 [Colwellia chukchiensis]
MRDCFALIFPIFTNDDVIVKISMLEVNPVLNKIKEIRERTDLLRGYL